MGTYKNSSVQSRVGDPEWLNNFWCWLADRWGWMSETDYLDSATVISQSDGAPDVGQAMRGEIIRAALNTIAASPGFPFKLVKRGCFAFVEYDHNGDWVK